MSDLQTDNQESIGRIEVAPEVIQTIAYYATTSVEGVAQTQSPSTSRFRRNSAKFDGIILSGSGNNFLIDIHIWIKPGNNMVETARAVQKAVFEAIDQMVGIPIQAVNVHVENVSPSDQTQTQPEG